MTTAIQSLTISIIRDNKRLSLIESTQTYELSLPLANQAVQMDKLYINQTSGDPTKYSKLNDFFGAIKKVNRYDEMLFAQIIFLLYRTTANHNGSCTTADISELLHEEEKPKASPRHPRAFKGTKFQRPTGKSPGLLDIREILMDSKNLDRLLMKLWPFRHQASHILNEWNCPIEGLKELIQHDTPPTAFEMKLKYPGIPTNAKFLISKLFNEEIMPILLNEHLDAVQIALRLYHLFDLEKNVALKNCLCRLLLLSTNKAITLRWLIDVAHIDKKNLLPTLVLIINSEIFNPTLPNNTIALINNLSDKISTHFYPLWAQMALDCLKQGYPAQTIDEYIQLALEANGEENVIKYGFFYQLPSTFYECSASVISSALKLQEDHDTPGFTCLNLWHNCNLLEGLHQVLHQAQQLNFTKKQFTIYIKLFAQTYYWHDDENGLPEKWLMLKKFLPKIQEHIQKIQCNYTKKWFDIFTDCISRHKTADDNKFLLALALATKLSQTPYLTHSDCKNTLSALTNMIPIIDSDRILTLPHEFFTLIDKVGKKRNESKLIACGLSAISELEPEFCFEALTHSPKKFISVLKIIGPISWNNKSLVIKNFKQHPVFIADYKTLLQQLDKMIEFVDQQTISRQYNPIAKALRTHITGIKVLSNHQLERHLNKLQVNLTAFKLQALEECSTLFLQGNFEAENLHSKNINHALKLYHSLERHESKKAFKRFLEHYLKDGSTTYRDQHPLNQQWLKQHPSLNLQGWHDGLKDFERDHLTLTIEHDPLEVLKLGTYVGSCFGLGGIWSESAVAILLDINKHVLYARNSSGIVVARQVIAISDNNELVPFEVYPVSTSKKVKEIFYEYNRHFAAELQLPIFKNNESNDYHISLILGKNWWDDGAYWKKEKPNKKHPC